MCVSEDIRLQLIMRATALFIKDGFDGTTAQEFWQALGWCKDQLYQLAGLKDNLINLLIEFFTEVTNIATIVNINLSLGEVFTNEHMNRHRVERNKYLGKLTTLFTVN